MSGNRRELNIPFPPSASHDRIPALPPTTTIPPIELGEEGESYAKPISQPNPIESLFPRPLTASHPSARGRERTSLNQLHRGPSVDEPRRTQGWSMREARFAHFNRLHRLRETASEELRRSDRLEELAVEVHTDAYAMREIPSRTTHTAPSSSDQSVGHVKATREKPICSLPPTTPISIEVTPAAPSSAAAMPEGLPTAGTSTTDGDLAAESPYAGENGRIPSMPAQNVTDVGPPPHHSKRPSVLTRLLRRNRVINNGSPINPVEAGPPLLHDTTPSKNNNTANARVFDTSANYFFYWISIVSTAYVYNLIVVIARMVFIDLGAGQLWTLWLGLDLLADVIYLLDMGFRARTGFLEHGLLVRDVSRIRALYLKNRQFKLDLASLLPADYIFGVFFARRQPALRLNRLLRKDRLQKLVEQTETRSSLPNAFRVGVVVWYIAVIIHWNACFYFMISESIGLGSDSWVYGVLNKQSLPEGIKDTLTRRYIYSFYWSTLILTTIGEVPGPQQNIEYVFVTVDLMCGVLIFATIVGNVGSMISNMSAARTAFQNRVDSIKQYMQIRRVGKQLEGRVIKWFDYLWANKQTLTDQQVLKVLPDKLQAEIAMHVHFETLRKVRIFQDCEAGLLAELVLKLQLQKGDIGREMYIVKRGMLQVVSDDGGRIFATLSEGAVFGELSILNIAGSKNGNRRTANVRSVGYTDLFALNKNDLWTALREYPEARKILIQKGRELLRKDNLLDESAPEEQKSPEEISEALHSALRILQIRIARLTAEHVNTETKLQERIAFLEGRLRKYE